MALTPYFSNVVVVGRFNPHIIVPSWLKKEGVCTTEKVEVLMFGELFGKQRGIKFDFDGFTWQSTDNRLIVESQDPCSNPAERVAKVLRLLPHTPINALGCNFHYSGVTEEWKPHLPMLGRFGFEQLSGLGEAKSSSWNGSVRIEDFVFGMSVEQNSVNIDVKSNIHRDADDAEKAAAICDNFEQDRKTCRQLVSQICDIQVEESTCPS